MTRHTSLILAALIILTAIPATWLIAGNLTPPPGPISPTMRTNQEIYDAVLATGTGTAPDCAAAPPGIPASVGTVTFSVLPGSGGDVTFNIYTFEHPIERQIITGGGGGGSGSTLIFRNLKFTRASDNLTPLFFRAITSPDPNTTNATIELYDASQQVYLTIELDQVTIVGLQPTLTKLCGSYLQSEIVSLISNRVRYTSPSAGTGWSWNIPMGTGS